jgi:hypothetical protein
MEIATERVLDLLPSRGDRDEADKAQRELPEGGRSRPRPGLLTKFGVQPPELMAGLSKEG